MEEMTQRHTSVLQEMEKELVGAGDQISALQEELRSLQAAPSSEGHAMDFTSQGEEGEPAILQVDTCDDITEVGGRGAGV